LKAHVLGFRSFSHMFMPTNFYENSYSTNFMKIDWAIFDLSLLLYFYHTRWHSHWWATQKWV